MSRPKSLVPIKTVMKSVRLFEEELFFIIAYYGSVQQAIQAAAKIAKKKALGETDGDNEDEDN